MAENTAASRFATVRQICKEHGLNQSDTPWQLDTRITTPSVTISPVSDFPTSQEDIQKEQQEEYTAFLQRCANDTLTSMYDLDNTHYYSTQYNNLYNDNSDNLPSTTEMMLHAGNKRFGNVLCTTLYYSGILSLFYKNTLVNDYLNEFVTE